MLSVTTYVVPGIKPVPETTTAKLSYAGPREILELSNTAGFGVTEIAGPGVWANANPLKPALIERDSSPTETSLLPCFKTFIEFSPS
jgi:hypothetical protein